MALFYDDGTLQERHNHKMEQIQHLLEATINDQLEKIILSNARNPEQVSKVKIRPVLIKGELVFQETAYKGTQVFHQNYHTEAIKTRISNYLLNDFKQGQVETASMQATILVGKKGTVTMKKKAKPVQEKKVEVKEHNRTKQYILEEGVPVDFLVELGVQTGEGKVVKARYDKFRQINRYLEFVKDVLPELDTERTIRIIDFGCGKSYLTFALYYYLKVQNHRNIEVIGLDLKETVIDHCSKLAEKLHYENLHFEKGDIGTFEGTDSVDMVVTLHACDTATDHALYKAIKWNAKVILSVPCCQHEVNRQIACEPLKPVLKYGLMKERMSALLTDVIRAELLEKMGYETQILEFIDMEHTPKNLLIRGVKRKGMQPGRKGNAAQEICDYLQVHTTLQRLLEQNE